MYTKGKWAIVKANHNIYIFVNNISIARINPLSNNKESNAQLIATAPKLLEVCKSAQEYIFKGGNSKILGAMLTSAIAEAEGE